MGRAGRPRQQRQEACGVVTAGRGAGEPRGAFRRMQRRVWDVRGRFGHAALRYGCCYI